MIQTLDALFDGVTLVPEVPLNIKSGTRVRIVVESLLPDAKPPKKSFLQTAKSLNLQGNPDWSENIDQYLHGENISENAWIFLHTSFAIALSAITDQNHVKALELAEQIESQNICLVTTQAILLEIGNALSKQKYRAAAIQLLESLESDPNVKIVPLTNELYDAAFQLFRSRQDKEWGLVDCISFVVMQSLSITEALTADDHFNQAGFKALLKWP